MGNKRGGFSIIEFIMAVLVMMIFAGTMAVSMNAAKQTAMDEAEKLAAYLEGLVLKSDRMNMGVSVVFSGEDISASWENNSPVSRPFEAGRNFL